MVSKLLVQNFITFCSSQTAFPTLEVICLMIPRVLNPKQKKVTFRTTSDSLMSRDL